MAHVPEFRLNQQTIGFVMGLIALITSFVGAYNWLLAGRAENSGIVKEMILKNAEQDKRLDRTDEDRQNNTKALKEQTAETQKLKEAVVKLTTVIENGSTPTKKAEYVPLSRPPIDLDIR